MSNQEAREARAALVEAIGWGERYGAHAVALTVSVASLRALVERYDRKNPEPEWEYGVRDVGSRDVFTDVYESVEDMIDDFDGAVAVQTGEEMVKRQKAGPWEPYEEGTE